VQLVEAVRRAAAVNRWRIRAVVPAIAAWLDASGLPGRRTTDRELPQAVVAVVGDTVQVARVSAGALTTLRRVSTTTPEEVVSAAGAGPGRALVLAAASTRARLERELSAAGWQLMPAPADAATAELAAAAFAGPTDLELIPESLAAQRAERQRSWALRVAVAAGLLFLGAAAVELWGAQRELDAVRSQRAALRPKVAPLMIARDSLMQLEQRQDLIAGLNAGSQRLTPALFDLALLLPSETHLTSLHANGDTLVIEAVGASAGEALEALRAARSMRAVRLEGVVERQLEAGATAAERFSLHARTVPLPAGAARRFPPVALPREAASARGAGNGTH
jgi:Tfp pilus assembly protein PilN